MATSEPDIKTKIAELRHEILSYKPGKAVPCDDELIVFPDQLVIGLIDACFVISSYDIISVLRRALHGDIEAIKYADRRESSTKGQEKYMYLTDSISVIKGFDTFGFGITGELQIRVKDLAAKVACFVVLSNAPGYPDFNREVAWVIKKITGCYPIVGLLYRYLCEDGGKREREWMRKSGIVEVYEIPTSDQSLSDTELLQLLSFLHGCLRKGDVLLANNNSKQLATNPAHRFLYEKAKKEAAEKQKMTEEIRQHKLVDESLQQGMKKMKMKPEESSASRESLVNENARLKKEIVREKEKQDAAEVTGTDQPKLEDPHGHSGKDGPPLGQGSPRGQTDVEETRATIEGSSPGDTSYMNEEENEGGNQPSEESSNHSTTE